MAIMLRLLRTSLVFPAFGFAATAAEADTGSESIERIVLFPRELLKNFDT